jgi:hypothetical protein
MKFRINRSSHRVITWIAAAVTFTAVVFTCADVTPPPVTVTTRAPAEPATYATGTLGVVKPTFPRLALVQAYRVLTRLPPIRAGAYAPVDQPTVNGNGEGLWLALRERVQGPLDPNERSRAVQSERRVGDFQWFTNCTTGTYATAARALDARIAQYGLQSREVSDWLRAQIAVLHNCGDGDLELPQPAPTWADRALQADRAYQLASAYFYSMHYPDALDRFQKIAADAGSPWQPYGRFLAARSLIREATIFEQGDRRKDFLSRAERELTAVLDDPAARPVHESARGLLTFVAARLRPLARVHELSAVLRTTPEPSDRDLIDFRLLMDAYVGDDVLRSFDPGRSVEELRQDDDLIDWLLASKGVADDSEAHALRRWRDTHSVPWLMAALWRIGPQNPEARAVLDAAAAVPRTSPAYATLSFFRVRLLLQRGERTAARAALARLPTTTGPGIDQETVNLLRAARVATADTFDELLSNAARRLVLKDDPPRDPVLGDDAARIFDRGLPLTRLADAAESPRLAGNLRGQLAVAAFTRAIVLDRPEIADRMAAVLRTQVTETRAEVTRYFAATEPLARRHAAILLLQRIPRMTTAIDGELTGLDLVVRTTSHLAHYPNDAWWCTARPDSTSGEVTLLGDGTRVAPPVFLSSAERASVEEERKVLKAAGAGREFLAREALAWSMAAKDDPDVPESLARAVHGWRLSICPAASDPMLPKRAFTTLHHAYAKSSWAAQTPYWFRD